MPLFVPNGIERSFRTGFRYGGLVMPPIAVYLWLAALI
jgi:hypothetical protein